MKNPFADGLPSAGAAPSGGVEDSHSPLLTCKEGDAVPAMPVLLKGSERAVTAQAIRSHTSTVVGCCILAGLVASWIAMSVLLQVPS